MAAEATRRAVGGVMLPLTTFVGLCVGTTARTAKWLTETRVGSAHAAREAEHRVVLWCDLDTPVLLGRRASCR